MALFLTVSGEKVIEEQVTETEDENTVYIHPVIVQKGENHTFTFLRRMLVRLKPSVS